MNSSQKGNIIFNLFKSNRSVFRFNDIAQFTGITDFQSLNNKINYAVRTGKLLNPRKGIYAKPGYKTEEMACTIYVPSYISLEYVLQKAGVVFQYDSGITTLSYLSRTIEVDSRQYRYRKIKGELLADTRGIESMANGVNIATAERAFMDMLYLEKEYYFDNLSPLDKKQIYRILPLYRSKTLTQKLAKLIKE
jgi:hypothetical protein